MVAPGLPLPEAAGSREGRVEGRREQTFVTECRDLASGSLLFEMESLGLSTEPGTWGCSLGIDGRGGGGHQEELTVQPEWLVTPRVCCP